jgi:prolyl-tRNA synthetase
MRLGKLPHAGLVTVPQNWKALPTIELLRKTNLISESPPGVLYISPILHTVYRRLESSLRDISVGEGFIETKPPLLMRKELVQRSGKLDTFGDEFYEAAGRGSKLIFSGTTEETFLDYIGRSGLTTYRQLPIRLFNFSELFRDIKRPEGIFKSRELYSYFISTLHTNETDYVETVKGFDRVCERFWKIMGIQDHVFRIANGGNTVVEYLFDNSAGDMTVKQSVVFDKKASSFVSSVPEDRDNKLSSLAMCYPFTGVEKFDVSFVGTDGKRHTPFMGTFGIGFQRSVYAIFELKRDERGIQFTRQSRPFDAVIIPVGQNEGVIDGSNGVYASMLKSGMLVAIDDRQVGLKDKFALADLLGVPYRLVIGEKDLASNSVELRERGAMGNAHISLDGVVTHVASLLRE